MTLSIARRARHWPDRTAVVDERTEASISYAEFSERIEGMAGRLATVGIDPGDRLVVLSRTRVELLSLLFAARKRGVTIAPISHRLPAETVRTLCDRIDPELALIEPRFADLLADVEAPQTDFETFDGRRVAASPDAESDVAPLFLHTGGTTGVPKVVPISERQLEWNAITESVAWGLDETTVTVNVLPLFHTGGWNLLTLPTLYSGGTVVVRSEFDPGETLRCIEEYGATQLFAVPAILRALADHPDFEETDFSTVKWVMSGGGPCPQAVREPYVERGETFLQGYGLTEGGPNNLYFSPDRDDEKPDSVGRPFPDCEARLVDAEGELLDGAGTGELELAGPVTADGYLETEDGTFDGDFPSGTAETHRVPGPWVSTGDVVRRDDDGDYYVVGRTDNMFVSGGENVYPEKIEDVLERHESVEAVGVTPVSHETWGQVPKAIVVSDVSAETLDAYAREHLADFQVPERYVFVDELPRTGAGKLDRDALARRFGHDS
jgi:fatty-acyl-CoA synthase